MQTQPRLLPTFTCLVNKQVKLISEMREIKRGSPRLNQIIPGFFTSLDVCHTEGHTEDLRAIIKMLKDVF